jgi:hypothetical protein
MGKRVFCVLVALVACGSTTSTSSDAGPDAYGHKDFDAAEAAVDAPQLFGDGTAADAQPSGCGSTDASSFTPTWQSSWKAPAAFGQNRCTPTEMSQYISLCAFTGASDPSTCATKLNAPNSLDCFQCMAPGASSNGPFTTAANGCKLTPWFNVGGCLANATDTSCASAWMNANDCAELACSDCLCGGGEDLPDEFHPCEAAGGNSTCDTVRASAACALGSMSPTVKTCLAMVDPWNNSSMVGPFAALFCGAGP